MNCQTFSAQNDGSLKPCLAPATKQVAGNGSRTPFLVCDEHAKLFEHPAVADHFAVLPYPSDQNAVAVWQRRALTQ